MSINAVGTAGPAYMPAVAPLPVRPALSIGPNDAQRPPPISRAENLARMESMLVNQLQAGSLNQKQASALSTFFASLATQTQMGGGPKELSSAEIIRKGIEAEEESEEEEAVGAQAGTARRKKTRAARSRSRTALKPDPVLNEALATFVKNLKDAQEKTAIYGASALSRSIASNEPVIVDETA